MTMIGLYQGVKAPTDKPEVTTVYEQVVGQIANVRFTTEYERIGI